MAGNTLRRNGDFAPPSPHAHHHHHHHTHTPPPHTHAHAAHTHTPPPHTHHTNHTHDTHTHTHTHCVRATCTPLSLSRRGQSTRVCLIPHDFKILVFFSQCFPKDKKKIISCHVSENTEKKTRELGDHGVYQMHTRTTLHLLRGNLCASHFGF